MGALGISRTKLMEYSEAYDEHLKKQRGPKCTLSALEQTLILLIFLRYHVPDILLGILFMTTSKTIYNTREKTLEFLYQRLKGRINMGSTEWRLANSICILNDHFSFVTDGSEQGVTGSSSPILDTLFYSNKKKKHTINTVVLINIITKRIIWVSKSYPCSYNDLDIMKLDHAEWSTQLQAREFGMGDSGFNGLQELNIPVCTADCIPSREFTKEYNHYRIRVENVFADIKDWAACKQQLRFRLENKEQILATHHKIWTVVSAFVNDKYDR